MIVTVSPLLVAGTDRGGEDLFLKFTCEVTGQPDFSQPQDSRGGFMSPFAPLKDGIVEEDYEMQAGPTEYEFMWEGKVADLREILKDEIRKESNWSRPGFSSNVCKFEYKHFVDGNAD
jgi:hypothetical protein